ncbi:MAG: WYL domain-containing protein [Anaerolineae bacterium]|nr:WYL domain-containing protein [Anaerolineales bacterium]MCW5848430.1 WYL domain-containing protein [Anaerolineae bacterium]
MATTLTLCLAYFAYCNPIAHRRGRLLRAEDARRLAARIGSRPGSGPGSLPLDPHLAFHLVWLVAADFLRLAPSGGLRPSPVVAWRLATTPDDPYASFLDESYRDQWAAAATCLRLDSVSPAAWLQMARHAQERRVPESPSSALARWNGADEDEWRFRLRPGRSSALLFELLALGCFEPPDLLRVSPLTLAAPHARYLGYDRVRWLLETATGGTLDTQNQVRLRDWLCRAEAYRLRGSLLLTAQPHQLAELYAARRLRPYLVEQIGPRCALFDRAGLPALRRRLAALGYPLDAGPLGDKTAHPPAASPVVAAPPDVAELWLGLRVLAGLQRYIPLPGSSPIASLDRLAATVGTDEAAGLDALADRLLSDLHTVIQGRDAFFPARRPPPADLVAQLRAAVAEERTVALDYWPAGAAESKRHVVEPLRLEERDQLIYLTAYSYRAEATLTFRLDRVQAVESDQ